MRQLYFDHSATTPVAPNVREAMLPFLAERYGDPSAAHVLGRACYEAVEDARGQVASLLGCDSEEVIFTASGTEANNLALKGLAFQQGLSSGGRIIISALEHASVLEPALFLQRLGFDVAIVPATRDGLISLEAVEQAITSDTLLVSVLLASHEIGTVQPISKISAICRAHGVLLHTDAAQAAGKMRIHVDELGVDLLTISAHKMCGPTGAGALFVRQGVALEPLLHGAGQEAGLRSGCENVAAIVGLGAAAELAAKSWEASSARLEELRERLLQRLQAQIPERLIVHGQQAPRLPTLLSVAFPRVNAQELLSRVPELCASSEAASGLGTSGSLSPTLAAMGASSEAAAGTIRLSLGWQTTDEEIERAASLLVGAWETLRG